MGKLIPRFITFAWVATCVGGAFLPLTDDAGSSTRPRDPWVFSGSLDDRSRVLFVALHHDLWVAYDLHLGDVYKAWRGAIEPASKNENAFSPWPATIDGLTYSTHTKENNWQLIRNGKITTPQVVYRGYRVAGDRLTVSYELISAYGHRITVEESPEVVHSPDNRPGLQREFFVDNVPAGFQVALNIDLTTLKNRTDVKTDGIFQRLGGKTHSFVWGKTHDVSGRLILTPGAATSLTTYFAPNVLKNMQDNDVLDPLELFKDTKVYQSMHQDDETRASSRLIRAQDHVPGVAVKVYGIGESIDSLMQLAPGQLPTSHAVETAIDLSSRSHFGNLDFYFITHVTGSLNIVSEGTYSFQVIADDGVRFSVSDQVYYEHNGLQAAKPSNDIDIYLKPGVYPFFLEHFQSTGRKQLTLRWKPPWSTAFEIVRAPTVSTKKEDQRRFSAGKKHILRQIPDALIALQRLDVDGVHPAINVEDLSVPNLKGSIGGMDFLSDGRLVVATWDGEGSIYLVDNPDDSDINLDVQPIAKGLAYPFGIKVIDDEIFVLQKQELTHLIDSDGDEIIDEYRVVANDWPLTNDFEEFTFGLVYREGKFYAGLAVPVDADGAILIEDLPERGHLVRLGFDGQVDKIFSGLQVPNGITLAEDGVLAVVDHRNPWFSDSRILFGGKGLQGAIQPATASQVVPLNLSSIWLPSGSATGAPTDPIRIDSGLYKGQWFYGDLNSPILNRVYVEEINGQIQGAVFRFSEGFSNPINRIVKTSEDALIVGGMGFDSQWITLRESETLLQKITFTDQNVFEMKAVRVSANGFEIEFSKPVDESFARDLSRYRIFEWSNDEIEHRRRKDRSLVAETEIQNLSVSADGLTVKLEIASLNKGRIYYFNLDPAFRSASGEAIWSNEAWYSLNELFQSSLGMRN